MKNRKLSAISLLLVIVMMIGMLASCGGGETVTTTEKPSVDSTETTVNDTTEKIPDESTETTTGNDDTEVTTDAPVEPVEPSEHDEIIQNASNLANGVQAYFTDGKKNTIAVENQNMYLQYPLSGDANQQITYLNNTQGKSYLQNTMDIFVKMKDGTTLYASKTSKNAVMNVFRLGYYYYETRIEGQDFANGLEIIDQKKIELKAGMCYDISSPTTTKDGDLYFMVKKPKDPWVVLDGTSFSASDYNHVRLTMKVDAADSDRTGVIYFDNGNQKDFPYQYLEFNLIADGEYHTYDIRLADSKYYEGDIKYLRFDLNNSSAKDKIYISELSLINGKGIGIPELSMARIFHTYSDKLHQEIQIATEKEVSDIDSIGFITQIPADTVDKIVVKDANGTHDTLDGVDWASVECIGFDIKDVGIFGYMLPIHETTGSVNVTLENGVYTIIQSRTPTDGKILPGDGSSSDRVGKVGNNNDFYMGNRLYTDETHTFDAFLEQSYLETHPLGRKNIKVSSAYSDMGDFKGYDPIRGSYEFYISGTDFNDAYHVFPNRHYKLNFSIKGDEYNRNIYVLAATASGSLECSVLLDENLMLLPIPIEVGKNFGTDGDENIYDKLDIAYGEAIFPLAVVPEELNEYTVLHLYQNWGNFPLKQLSFIEYSAPYYHMSTGVTESNCLVPLGWTTNWNVTNMLPDHRAMSAPMWAHQPQHEAGGIHSFLSYVSEENKNQGATISNQVIDSYGPTYFELTMNHVSDNGKFKVSYTNMEMPQTDENRAYYTLEYKFIEDMKFEDFSKTFSFYSVGDRDAISNYLNYGYLDENNECVVVQTNNDESNKVIVLGDKCPYFDYFELPSWESNFGYVNVSCLIKDHEVIIGGVKKDVNMAIRKNGAAIYLTLDLDDVTFKAGDSITINAILVPWGSQNTDYDTYGDQQIRDLRENTLLNPMVATPGENTVSVESAFVPKVATTNGKSAEFTLSGGKVSEYPEMLADGVRYNVAVRAYGFKKLTVPKVYEKINGEWVEYQLSSANSLDKCGYGAHYDGYSVYYDEDGTYSYSFVVDMTAAQPRTFKVELDEEFEKWPIIQGTPPALNPIEVYLDHIAVNGRAGGVVARFTAIEAREDNGVAYSHFLAGRPSQDNGRGRDAFFTWLENGSEVSGQYFVIKYRTDAENNMLQVFASAKNTSDSFAWNDGISINTKSGLYIADGEWHIVVIDLSKIPSFTQNENGEYVAKSARLDVFNYEPGDVTTENYVDIAFMGIGTDLKTVVMLDETATEVLFYDGSLTVYDPATGEVK